MRKAVIMAPTVDQPYRSAPKGSSHLATIHRGERRSNKEKEGGRAGPRSSDREREREERERR
jgi:hypothetical protein